MSAPKRQKLSGAMHRPIEEAESSAAITTAASSASTAAASATAQPAAAAPSTDESSSSSSSNPSNVSSVIAQFVSNEGVSAGPQIELPLSITRDQLHALLNKLLENEERVPYSFFLKDAEEEIVENLQAALKSAGQTSTESIVSIVYQPQAIFRVRAVTRCTATIPGHSEATLHVQFSGDGRVLATGSGDTTVRIWDVLTETPKFTCRGHKDHVLALAWSPNGRLVASGGRDAEVRLWDHTTGKLVGKPFKGHTKWITALAWEPLHKNFHCTRLASASKDGDIRIWDVVRRQCVLTLSGHTSSIHCLRWGGQGLLYSGSQDRTIKVWAVDSGKLVRTLEGHAHWVNTMSLNTDYAMRTGPFDHKGQGPTEESEVVSLCQKKYDAALTPSRQELLVSGSDDFTLMLWDPVNTKKAIIRMTGHQQPVNHVCYSPDGRYIASASFDKSVKLWHGASGKFITTFRAHVQAVYQVCWSADSRLLVSSSKDSTMKVWDITSKKMKMDLPGHADEVFACDWSPDGERVASGGKDQVVKIWRQ